ncbi:GIY-YIG nuclease family protein [Methylophaga lonarensis]|uniref:GIY-YIG nuclease family protein n=1 Tax=Methylophaga lonarensis TaxID=999151 RepID=UPI003D27C1E5
MKQPAIYIMTNKRNGTLYVGVTSHLIKRVWEHKNNVVAGFTQKYRLHQLVYFELHDSMIGATSREKQIKKWRREWKINLIEKLNADWRDLYSDLL